MFYSSLSCKFYMRKEEQALENVPSDHLKFRRLVSFTLLLNNVRLVSVELSGENMMMSPNSEVEF